MKTKRTTAKGTRAKGCFQQALEPRIKEKVEQVLVWLSEDRQDVIDAVRSRSLFDSTFWAEVMKRVEARRA